ncbi:hemin-degrading factor [Glaciimonas soli]|uniref:Hemin-degrading factor n=1 Tax=Glaciimonas soli TaxID=2590999 RepID=A0A843YWB3_9BURK|nr:ChuX/HutX family heme-like substrate-binding protein [Glaciimonas soli]MQR01964.1 hemin-degrading factor [Glaciimonas soli]
MNITQNTTLRTTFLKTKSSQNLRNREAAALIGISEAEAIATCIGKHDNTEVIRLKPDFINIMEQVPQLGSVMALTRNDSAVHEKDGAYLKMSHNGHVGLALGEAIDLRIFYSQWKFGCAVIEETPRGIQKSLQFFDRHGTAVHKVFLREHSQHEAYEKLVQQYRDGNQQPGISVEEKPSTEAEIPNSEVDVTAFQAAWNAMTDTHQFFGLLNKFRLSRTQALRLAPPQFVRQVNHDALKTILENAAAIALPIMVFVGNSGMIQIHSGPVNNIKVMGPWINVLDTGFNLHLRENMIAGSWVVSKPTLDGIVTSLELFDRDGQTIAMLFGVRKPGQAELPVWREMVAALPELTTTSVSA